MQGKHVSPNQPGRRRNKEKTPLRIEFDGVIIRSIAQILSGIAEIFDEFKNWIIRRLRKY